MSSELAVSVVIGAGIRAGFSSIFGRAKNTVKELGSEIQNVTRKQESLGKSIAKGLATGKSSLGVMRAQYDLLGKSIEKAQAAQRKLNIALGKQEKAKAYRRGLRSEMMDTAGHGAVAAAPIISSVKIFLKEESAETDLKMAMQKSNGSFGAFETVRREVVKLGKELPGTTADFFRLGKALKSQGLSDSLLTNGGLHTSAKLNTVMQMNQEEGGAFFAKLIEARGLNESEFAKAADITQRAYFGFGMNKEDMFESMKYNAPTMNMLNLKGLGNYEKMMAIEGMGAQVGLEGSQFGTNFSMMLDQMAAGPKQLAMAKSGMKKIAKDILEKSNVDFEFFDKSGKFKGLEGMISELEKLKKIKQEQGDEAASIVADELFGAQAKRTALTIAEKGRAGLEVNLKLMREQADLDSRIATKTATLGAALESLGGVAEHTAAIFGSAFAPDIQKFAKTAQDFLENTFQPWLQQNKELIKTGAGLFAGLFAGKLAVLGLAYGFSMLMMPVRSVGIAFAKLSASFRLVQLMRLGKVGKMQMFLRMFGMSAKTAAKASSLLSATWRGVLSVGSRFLGVFKGLGTVLMRGLPLFKAFGQGLLAGFGGMFKVFGIFAQTVVLKLVRFLPMLSNAFLMLGRTLLMTPIGLAFTAMATAAYLLYTNWDSVVGGAKLLWQDLGNLVGNVANSVSMFFSAAWTNIQAFFSSGIVNISAQILNWSPIGLFYQTFAAVLNWFGVTLPATFTGFGQMLITGLINGIKAKAAEAIAVMKNFAARLQLGFTIPNRIHSPSRVFMQYGGFLMDGLNIGLKRGQTQPLSQMSRLSDKLQNRIENADLSETALRYSQLSQARQDKEAGIQGQSIGSNAVTIYFNPTYNVNSQNFNPNEAAKMTMRDFENLMKRYQHDLQRRAY